MKCQNCKNKVNVTYLDNKLCNQCFLQMIEKRIRKYLRINKLIKKNDKIITIGNLTHYILTKILEKLPLNIKKLEKIPEKVPKDTKIVIPWTLDHENHYFLKHFIENKPQPFLKDKNFIKILLPITDKEAQILAKIKKLKYEPLKQDQYTKLFEILEPKYSSVRYAFASSVKEFKKI